MPIEVKGCGELECCRYAKILNDEGTRCSVLWIFIVLLYHKYILQQIILQHNDIQTLL